MHYVIGSGPSGVAGAAALIAAGREVTMLDAGLTLEQERETRRLRMAVAESNEWSEEDTRASRAPFEKKVDRAVKLHHGSDYPYRSVAGAISIDYGNLSARSSFAKGGLSNVWGAALLPFRREDTEDWPVAATELENAHAAVLDMLPIAGARDDLAQLFPLPTRHLHTPRSGKQIERLMATLARNRVKLARRGVMFGASRLAVQFSGRSQGESCNYCGQCLQGCPRDLIYSSRHTLEKLIASGRLTYTKDVVVERISERGQSVEIHAVSPGGPTRFQGERVFLATGVFNSTAILLRSLGWFDRPVEIADAQYYVFPLLQIGPSVNVSRERVHTLAQVFLEISREEISPRLVHLQLYGYNDVLGDILKHKLGRLWRYFPGDTVLGRLLLVQGYLHSEHSGHITACLRRREDTHTLELQGVANPDSADRVSRIIRLLRRLSFALGAVPVASLLQMTSPGRGFHSGGSFPMARNPRAGQTDVLGRPAGWVRTHVLDATILPSIPTTTITQTVMANAYRIGALASQLDTRT
jgi:choline dehydrogenase-like flavoprotein